MQPGDLVKIPPCPSLEGDEDCECWYCSSCTSGVGYITGLGPENSYFVHFDCGERLVPQNKLQAGHHSE